MKPQVKDAVIYLHPPKHPPPPSPNKKKRKKYTIYSPEISVKVVFPSKSVLYFILYFFFLYTIVYLIERYLCSTAFSAFTSYHLQFCYRSSSNIASEPNNTALKYAVGLW